MKSRLAKLSIFALLAASMAASPRAEGALPKIFGFGKADPKPPPGAAQLATQEARAMQRLTEIAQMEARGKDGSAAKAYEKLASEYPFTKTAATAQFRAAQLYEKETKKSKSFDAYQVLIDKFPQSAEYATAIERQFMIANELRANPGGFFGVGRRTTEDLVEMYQKVINNGKRSVFAPKAQFAIAELYAQRNDVGDNEKSVAAFQKLVDTYPESPEAADAAFKIGQVNFDVSRKSRDSTNLTKAREAFESASTLFGDNPQVGEAQQKLLQITDAEAEKAYKAGLFYEKKGQLKAAVIYFTDVLKAPTSPHFVDARGRLSTLSSRDPKLLDSMPGIKVAQADIAVPARSDTKSRPDYFGPPPPPERTRKPQMRVNETIPFTPIEEPALPTRGETMVPGDEDLLLPAAPGSKPAQTTLPPVETLVPPPAEPAPVEAVPPTPEPEPEVAPEAPPATTPETPAPAPGS